MSKILKTMWNKSDKRSQRQSEANINVSAQQEINSKPFEIDLKTLWKYDNEELCDFIMQYEQLIYELRKQYQDMSEEYPLLKEKITLDEMERKRLTEELEQYKLQCQNLKSALEQKTNSRPVQKSLSNCVVRAQETAQKQNPKTSEAEMRLQTLEAENKKLLEDTKKEFELKLHELKTQTNEQAKIIEDLINQNNALEKRNSELEAQLSALTVDSADLKQKFKRTAKDLEISKELNDSLRGVMENSATEGSETKESMGSFNKIINDLEKSKMELNEELKNAQLEISNLKAFANALKDETERLQKALSAKDARALDLENKLIQERLKVEQLKRDLTKVDESYKEAKAHLNEQITKNHEMIRTRECRENEFTELNRKYRESKKTLKKTMLQLATVQNQLQDEQTQKAKLEQVITEQQTDSTKPDDTDDEFTMHGLSSEVRVLRDKLEMAIAEAAAVKEENKTLNKLLTNERKELELLKEKREAGVKEIKRLNTMIEKGKIGRASSKPSQQAAEDEDGSGHINVISTVKKNLEALYKQFIVSIQYEKSLESESGSKSLRNAVQGYIPPDNVVRLEKNLNDAIFFVREYLENVQ